GEWSAYQNEPGSRALHDEEDLEEGDEDWQDDDDLENIPDGTAPAQRSLCVFRTSPGWIGVLDSGAMAADLAPLLSAHLKADTLSVMVNHSDSWWYQIHRHGVPFDEFDSMGAGA